MFPLIFGGVACIVPQFRRRGKKLVFGVVGSVAGMIVYQIFYIPVFIALCALTALAPFILSPETAGPVIGICIILNFYVIWLFVMMAGFISGFRVGSAFSTSMTLRDSLRRDFLYAAYAKRTAHISK